MSKFEGLLSNRTPKSPQFQISETPEVQRSGNKVGRPRAKRSSPDYQQITAYIRKDTYAAARKLLIDREQDFSELIEELTSEWVKRQSK